MYIKTCAPILDIDNPECGEASLARPRPLKSASVSGVAPTLADTVRTAAARIRSGRLKLPPSPPPPSAAAATTTASRHNDKPSCRPPTFYGETCRVGRERGRVWRSPRGEASRSRSRYKVARRPLQARRPSQARKRLAGCVELRSMYGRHDVS